jgi:hypothetical protein
MTIPKQLPVSEYNGITIILDKPSRFDEASGHLLSGITRDWFRDATGVNPDECEIRLTHDKTPFQDNTQHVILSGFNSISQWTSGRHSLLDHCYDIAITHKGQVYRSIGVHNLQDCVDYTSVDGDEDDADDAASDNKDHCDTRRNNYPFWTGWAVKKLLGQTIKSTTNDFNPIIYPNLQEVVKLLLSTKGQDLYVDIECSRAYGTLDCVGFRINQGPVYVVPVYLYNGKLAYSQPAQLLHALSIAFQRNRVIGHNIAGFDLVYLASQYRIAFGRSLYDTMLANHRLFAEAEKSLGHVIGQWTAFEYHKDQIIVPHSREDDQRLWMYNARDVHRLYDLVKSQQQYAATIPGQLQSIAQVNRCIYPYLKMSLKGIKVNGPKLAISGKDLHRRIIQLDRIANWLVGRPISLNSPKQIVDYFHGQLHYPPVMETKSGAPGLGKKALYMLGVRHDNPLIGYILGYRKLSKDLSSLNFKELKIR